MYIFASWSGDDSKLIAELLHSWIPSVIQEAEVYVSSRDIGKGEQWLDNITKSLENIDFGIIIITPTNIVAPWILFEAGALSKSINSRVVPLLCNVENFSIAQSPLGQFQTTNVEKNDIFKLITQINSHCARPLSMDKLKASFEIWWPDFISKYNNININKVNNSNNSNEKADDIIDIKDLLGSLALEVRRLRRENTYLSAAGIKYSSTSEADMFEVSPARDGEMGRAELQNLELEELMHQEKRRQIREMQRKAERDRGPLKQR